MKMGSKGVHFLGFLALILLVSASATARNLAESTVPVETSEVSTTAEKYPPLRPRPPKRPPQLMSSTTATEEYPPLRPRPPKRPPQLMSATSAEKYPPLRPRPPKRPPQMMSTTAERP